MKLSGFKFCKPVAANAEKCSHDRKQHGYVRRHAEMWGIDQHHTDAIDAAGQRITRELAK